MIVSLSLFFDIKLILLSTLSYPLHPYKYRQQIKTLLVVVVLAKIEHKNSFLHFLIIRLNLFVLLLMYIQWLYIVERFLPVVIVQ